MRLKLAEDMLPRVSAIGEFRTFPIPKTHRHIGRAVLNSEALGCIFLVGRKLKMEILVYGQVPAKRRHAPGGWVARQSVGRQTRPRTG